MSRRVVITGMGAVTPIGNDVSEFWESLKKGKSGIGPITRFDNSEYKCRIAGEVDGFEPETRIEKKEIRRMDLFTQYALYAADMAVEDAKLFGHTCARWSKRSKHKSTSPRGVSVQCLPDRRGTGIIGGV